MSNSMSASNTPSSATGPEVVNNGAPPLRVVAIMPTQLAELGQEEGALAQAVGEADDNLVYVELSTLLMAMNSRLEEIAQTLATIAQNQGAAPTTTITTTNDQKEVEDWEPDRLPFEEFAAEERRRGEPEQELEARWFYHAEYIPPPAGRRETARERLNRMSRMGQRFKGYCKRRGLPPSRGGLKRRRKD